MSIRIQKTHLETGFHAFNVLGFVQNGEFAGCLASISQSWCGCGATSYDFQISRNGAILLEESTPYNGGWQCCGTHAGAAFGPASEQSAAIEAALHAFL